jgi:hypothetical protein
MSETITENKTEKGKGTKIVRCIALFAAIFTGDYSHGQTTSQQNFDVVIVGGSSGAIGAAIGAARSGVSVVLIEDTPVLGGMLSNGISNIDCYSYQSLSGVFDEFRTKVKAHYTPLMSTDPVFKSSKKPSTPQKSTTEKPPASNAFQPRARQTNEAVQGGRWEPHVADKIFKEMAANYPNLTIYYNRFATGVIKDKNRLVSVVTNAKDGPPITFSGKMIIDATHEADVAAWAGAPYRVGREARSREEPHAGEIYFYNNTGEIIPGGSRRQDQGIVSYGIRLCIQYYDPSKGSGHIIKRPPPGYNAAMYQHAIFGSGDTFDPSMPNLKTEMNKNPIGNELQEVNWTWPEASRLERAKMYEFYKNHALGFLYYLQNERGVKNIGLPKDEFTDNGNIPYRVFVREARRIVGEVTLNESDINPFIADNPSLTPPFQSKSIAVGHYPIDAKPVRQKRDITTPDKGEGDFFLSNVVTPFQVPYGAIVPKDVEGLLVPVALSATHVAFSAIRMDPTWTVLGQAAGVAAGISVKTGTSVRNLDVDAIQAELLSQKSKLVFYWDVAADHPNFKDIQTASIKGWIQPQASRDFYPDSLLTRAEAAQLLVNSFGLWPSVSNIHFSDVDYRHTAFRAIETLFDLGVLRAFGVEPRWPQAGGYGDKKDGFDHRKSNFGLFYPDQPVSAAEFMNVVQLIKKGQTPDTDSRTFTLEAPLTRAKAVSYLIKKEKE